MTKRESQANNEVGVDWKRAILSLSSFIRKRLELPVPKIIERRAGSSCAKLRACALDPRDQSLTVLHGKGGSMAKLRGLVSKERYSFVMNGTFFGAGKTLGDVRGVNFKNNKKTTSAYVPENGILSQRINNRYTFGVSENGKAYIERTFKAKKMNLLEKSTTFLGGLAGVDFNDPRIQKALSNNDGKAFRTAFNMSNSMYNGTFAYQGLDGSRGVSRTAIGIVSMPSGQQLVVPLTVGNGANRNEGITIFGLVQSFYKLARDLGGTADKLAICDGGSSTYNVSSRGTAACKGGFPTTAIAVVDKTGSTA